MLQPAQTHDEGPVDWEGVRLYDAIMECETIHLARLARLWPDAAVTDEGPTNRPSWQASMRELQQLKQR